jgi:hypothetical protein
MEIIHKQTKRMYLAIGLSILSFILLQVSVLIFPSTYLFFGNTISTLSAVVVNGEPNYYSAITLPLSHFCLASGIAIFSSTSSVHYLKQAPKYTNLIKLINIVTLLRTFAIVIAAVTPHGVPEPFGKVHRFFGVLMFAIFGASAFLLIGFNYLSKGMSSAQTFVPLIFVVVCLSLVPFIYVLVELQWLPDSRLVPSYQKFGYYLFVIAMTIQMILFHSGLIKENKK